MKSKKSEQRGKPNGMHGTKQRGCFSKKNKFEKKKVFLLVIPILKLGPIFEYYWRKERNKRMIEDE